MNDLQTGIITLLKSAVTGEKLTLPEGFSMEDAQELIGKQGLTTLAFEGAVNCGISTGEPKMQKLLQGYYRYLLRSERQMAAVERLFRAFEENGIEYMPLKGCEMKKMYPKPELRIMGDADVLIRMEQYDRIRAILEEQGYQKELECDHTLNWRSDALYLELHRRIVPSTERDLAPYFGDGWGKARLLAGTRYAMSREDAYLFLFSHFTKHIRHGGIGCRHMLDLWVYRRACPEMDETYLAAELEKLRLLEFHGNILRTLDVWFADGEGDARTEWITEMIFSGGSFGGKREQVIAESVQLSGKGDTVKHSRLRAAWELLFPPAAKLAFKYTFLEKRPWLLPGAWVLRWVDVLLHRRGNISLRGRELGMISDSEVERRRRAFERVGLFFGSEEEM